MAPCPLLATRCTTNETDLLPYPPSSFAKSAGSPCKRRVGEQNRDRMAPGDWRKRLAGACIAPYLPYQRKHALTNRFA